MKKTTTIFGYSTAQMVSATTHTDEIVSIVIFFGCEVVQVSGVLVLQGPNNRKVKIPQGSDCSSILQQSRWLQKKM